MGLGGEDVSGAGAERRSHYANVTIEGLCTEALRNTSQDNPGGRVCVPFCVTAGERNTQACVRVFACLRALTSAQSTG